MQQISKQPAFEVGQIVATPGALAALKKAGQQPGEFLTRHLNREWGDKAANLNRFLVVCALVSDLYRPGYNPKQSLEKNSNLARTAVRYKVDMAKLATAVRTELSKSKKKTEGRTQPTNKRASNSKQSEAAPGKQGKK